MPHHKRVLDWKLIQRHDDHPAIKAVDIGLEYAGQLIGNLHATSIAPAPLPTNATNFSLSLCLAPSAASAAMMVPS
ncbi:hypothetical protein ACFFV8_04045 [Sphingobium indicum]|uniref:hypothetical protein n=1 Tax=Sphingobium TaxID=165695 RepID=UPI001427D068|nr:MULTISPECIES: hypothetical protein [Sphingobium]